MADEADCVADPAELARLTTECLIRRGKRAWVWCGSGVVRFAEFPGARQCHEISYPAGWGFVAERNVGAVLRHWSGSQVVAASALHLATRQQEGFRLVKSWIIREGRYDESL
jgi:hypothetical protein